MTELTTGDLRRLLEFGRAALDVRDTADVEALLRRLRHLVPGETVTVHEIGPRGIGRWREPSGPGRPGSRRLVASGGAAGAVVHVSVWRAEPPFDERDRHLLEMALPFLARALAGVGAAPEVSSAVDEARLTGREAQVLSLVADGSTNKEVGSALGISPRTVQKHLEHIYDKLGTHRRTAAARWFSGHLSED